jgi:hypothetical protein
MSLLSRIFRSKEDARVIKLFDNLFRGISRMSEETAPLCSTLSYVERLRFRMASHSWAQFAAVYWAGLWFEDAVPTDFVRQMHGRFCRKAKLAWREIVPVADLIVAQTEVPLVSRALGIDTNAIGNTQISAGRLAGAFSTALWKEMFGIVPELLQRDPLVIAGNRDSIGQALSWFVAPQIFVEVTGRETINELPKAYIDCGMEIMGFVEFHTSLVFHPGSSTVFDK